jgi:hypothetical protein
MYQFQQKCARPCYGNDRFAKHDLIPEFCDHPKPLIKLQTERNDNINDDYDEGLQDDSTRSYLRQQGDCWARSLDGNDEQQEEPPAPKLEHQLLRIDVRGGNAVYLILPARPGQRVSFRTVLFQSSHLQAT